MEWPEVEAALPGQSVTAAAGEAVEQAEGEVVDGPEEALKVPVLLGQA